MQSAPTTATLARALKPNRPEPLAEDDEFGREMARLARRRRVMIWVVALLALAGILAVAVPILRKRFASISPAAHSKLEQARKKLLLDDLQSLAQAAELDAQAARLAPGEPGPEGERAFALLLAAGVHKDLADRAEAKVTALGDEMAKLQIAKPDGFEKQLDVIRAQMLQQNDEREPHVHAATQLHQQGLAAAKVVLEEDPDEPAALRAMALHSALNSAVDSGNTFADRSDSLAPNNPFTTYVRAQLWLCGSPSREKQDRGLSLLSAALQAEPRMLRALYDTAAIEADRQLTAAAREKLERILAANPQHERAQRLRAQLTAPPPPAAAAPPAPAPATP